MLPRIGRNTVASDALFATGVVSLVGGISLLFAANFAAYSFKSAPTASINLRSLSWLANVKTGSLPLPQSALAEADEMAKVKKFAPLSARIKLVSKTNRSFAKKKTGTAKTVVVRDKINATMAAPVQAAVLVSEHEKMQNLHAMLREKFLTAMIVLEKAPLQLAAQIEKKPVAVAIQVKKPAKRVNTQPKKEIKIAAVEEKLVADQVAPKIAPRLDSLVAEIARNHKPLAKTLKPSKATKIQDRQIAATFVNKIAQPTKTEIYPTERVLKKPEKKATPPATGPPQTMVKQPAAVIIPPKERGAEVREVAPQIIAPIVVLTTQIPVSTAPTLTNGYPKKHDYPPRKQAKKPEQPGQPQVLKPKAPLKVVTDVVHSFMAAAEEKPGCVSAFDQKTEIALCDHQNLSNEIVDLTLNTEGHWTVAQAKEHWPTLFWKAGPTPLISNNDVKLLALRAETQVQEDSGIIFGKVPAGWTISLSSRSDRPVFLAKDAGANPLDSERNFAFINVEPGAPYLYMSKISTGETASVGLPVMNGIATYIDLSQVEFKEISGKVFDAASRTGRGLKGVTVSVIGQSAVAQTNVHGEFILKRVAVISGLPVYLETYFKTTYPHRYRLAPKQFSEAALYRFNDKQIDDWVGQVEGGVSAESALVVAALPGLVKRAPTATFQPSLKVLLREQTLPPETYALSPAGDLKPGATISNSNPRFLGLQVPKGPVVAGIKNDLNEPVWSELLLVSPRVISVVGPY